MKTLWVNVWNLPKQSGNSKDVIETVGHSGSLPGFCAVYTRIPSTHSAIILLDNTGRAYLNAMTTAITGILNDKPYDLPKKSIAKLLFDKIEQEGINSGIQFFNNFKDDVNYYVNEEELNIVSYKFNQSNDIENAVAVLKIGISFFPNAFFLTVMY